MIVQKELYDGVFAKARSIACSSFHSSPHLPFLAGRCLFILAASSCTLVQSLFVGIFILSFSCILRDIRGVQGCTVAETSSFGY